MDPKEQLVQAKHAFDQLGGDPHIVFAVLEIAKAIENDPQKLHAILAIARFISKKD